MKDQQKRIMDRIRKLLTLSESPYEAEAAAALAKAYELLSRQGLAISDLSAVQSGVVELPIASAARINPWEERLLKCILSATYTEALRVYDKNEQELIIIGREARAISAKILYEYLHEAVKRKADLFRDSIDDLESFRIGMVDGIRRKLQDRQKAGHSSSAQNNATAATKRERVRENREYIKENYGNPGSSDTWYGVDPNSYGLGQGIGRKIGIDRQLFSPNENEE